MIFSGGNDDSKVGNLIKMVGNGGKFEKQLINSIKLLAVVQSASRPSLRQYRMNRREDRYFYTPKPKAMSHSYPTQCANGSTKCILAQLRAQGLIRTSLKDPLITTTSSRIQSNRGRYRPDCWTNDDESDHAPPTNYAEHSDNVELNRLVTARNKKQGTIWHIKRRRSSDDSHPCLWQEEPHAQLLQI